MNCRESRPLLPLFLDGELEARQMRAVALHSTRCVGCEDELRQIERLQELIATHVAQQVEEVDPGTVWAGVAPRLTAAAPPWHERLRAWWEVRNEGQRGWLPLSVAVTAAAGVLAVMLWQAQRPTEPAQLASAVDNSAILDSVESNVDSVALLREPETNTMVLWITDDAPVTAGDFGDVR